MIMQYIELCSVIPGRMTCSPSTLNNHCPLTPVLPLVAISRTALVRDVGSIRFLVVSKDNIICKINVGFI